MRFKRIILIFLIFGLIFCFVSIGYSSNYGGYFFQGFTDGLKKGLQIGEQSKINRQSKETREIKWQQRQLKIAEEEEEKWLERWNIFTNSAQKLINSMELDPVNKRKYWFSLLWIPYQILEHKINLIYGIIGFDKDKVEGEIKYIKNANKVINLTDRQMNFKLLDNLSSLLSKEVELDMFSFMYESLRERGMKSFEIFFNEIINSVYSPNITVENVKTEILTKKEIFGDTSLAETQKIDFGNFNAINKSTTPINKQNNNPFENSWSYEKLKSSLKYNPFENKWEYAEPGDTLKYNPFENIWGYD